MHKQIMQFYKQFFNCEKPKNEKKAYVTQLNNVSQS